MGKSIENTRLLLEEITMQCDANWIAFSGGLDSSILAQIKKDQGLNAITIIAKDFLGTDLPYSQIAAKHIDIPLELKYVNIDEMLSAIESTIKILKNFNDIEIRNSIVPYLYLNTLKEKNVTKVITGDGADEIFAGYNFLVKKGHTELKSELKRIKEIMHFTSQKIANELSISIQMPFIDENIIRTVETLPANLLINQKDGIKFGKWILRKAFENDLPTSVIWREKTPMQDGSGTASLTKLFDTIITDDIFEEKTKKIKSGDNVTIRTKESLHYYELYKENFRIPEYHDKKNLCSDCNAEIDSNSKFCRMCGKFPI
uniref:Asparagine synthase (AsnB, ASNS) n=2 Tax=environmental samples TaxID=651140 RepID=A0A075H672_9ARCH|nr:asparagine synthase (asnB, ASNS) [uncultured marine thaumarchaeote KM3_52_F05]AIF11551.1 asparagine synthase (asnB, ASNS) [uncultured marine thaumarchaeote KM3_52_H04]